MNQIKYAFVVLAIVMISVSSCYNDNEEVLYPKINSNCDTSNVTFSSSISAILDGYCLNCHNNSVASAYGGGVKLEDYADVKTNINRIYGSVKHQNGFSAMPKGGGSISNCSILTIEAWMKDGTPNN